MRNSFFGYYRPTDEEYETLWKNALIVFDANALLNFYRVPPSGREALFKTLEYFADRLWIPHQAGLEFHRNRFEVVRKQKKLTTDALTKTGALIQDLRNTLNEIKIDQHDISFDPSSALEKLATPLEEISGAIRKVKETEINLISSDPVRDRLDAIFSNKIGPAPKTQQELNDLCQDVANRYQSKIPPGWKDAETKKDQSFYSDHLHYQNANGDLIFWRQLIEHLKSEGIKNLILVTNENKEDWWWKESGEIVGPLPELMREIKREAGVDLFWMYKTDLFLNTSQKYTSGVFNITPEAVAEVREVVERENLETRELDTYESQLLNVDADFDDSTINRKILRILKKENENLGDLERKKAYKKLFLGKANSKSFEDLNKNDTFDNYNHQSLQSIIDAERWLIENRGVVIDRPAYGDFAVMLDGEVHQYRFDFVGTFNGAFDLVRPIRSAWRRSLEAGQSPITRFIFAVSPNALRDIDFSTLSEKLQALLDSLVLDEIILTVSTPGGLRTVWMI